MWIRLVRAPIAAAIGCNPGEISVVDEMMLYTAREISSQSSALAYANPIQRFSVEPIKGSPPLQWISLVIPNTRKRTF